MRAELVAVGSELLLGDAVDTNSAWISARLAEVGVDVHRHVTVGDNIARMVDVIGEAVARADAVVVTGGLGPTQDDLTRVAVARVAGVDLERRDDLVAYLREYFHRGGRQMPERNLVQADLPAGAVALTPVGTAAGFMLDVDGAAVCCLPGVPAEMRGMVSTELVPRLVERWGLAATVSRLVRTGGMSESAVADACADLVERLDAAGNPTIAFLASRGETRVRVTAKAFTPDEARDLAAPVVDEVVAILGAGVVGVDDEGVEHAVARQLRSLGWTLAVGESVTGGGVGARLVRVAGASDWFRGGLVAYATAAKQSVAGVEAEVLESHGAASEATAAALAAGARDRLGADVGLGVVGVAGPGPQDGRPVGTVCLGVAAPGGFSRTRSADLPARDRAELQELVASVALDWLRRRLAALADPTADGEEAGSLLGPGPERGG